MKIYCKIAENPLEKENSYKVRYSVFCRDNQFIKSELLDIIAMEFDKYDRHSVHYIAMDGDKTIGTVRNILPKSGNKFPIEELYDLSKLPENFKYVESSRSSVLSQYQGGMCLFNLWKIMMSHADYMGFTHLLMTANPETDNIDMAELMCLKAAQEGMKSDIIEYLPLPHAQVSHITNPGDHVLSSIKYPPTVKMYLRFGAQITGKAVYYKKVNMCAIPMVIDLKKIKEPYYSRIFLDNPYDFSQSHIIAA